MSKSMSVIKHKIYKMRLKIKEVKKLEVTIKQMLLLLFLFENPYFKMDENLLHHPYISPGNL